MKHKRILSLLLSLILIFSVLCSSCAEEPAPPVEVPNNEPTEENGAPSEPEAPSEEDENGQPETEEPLYFTVKHRYQKKQIPYIMLSAISSWRRPYRMRDELDVDRSLVWVTERVPWDHRDSDYISPGDVILELHDVEWAHVQVSPDVYEEMNNGWDFSTQQFVICGQGYYNPYETFDAYYNSYFPGIDMIDGSRYGIWEGTTEELKSIAKALYEENLYWFGCYVCSVEEFYYIFGLTVEQAQVLIANGHLDLWCLPTQNSPLYDLSPTEIAAYIAAHPELLEEDA